MSERPIDPTFNRQRTVVNNVVTSLVIETALPLVLTQNPSTDAPNHQLVPESAHLRVFADEVTVSGSLKLPGRTVEIFARLLRTEADGAAGPAISVDGATLSDDLATPPALKKGDSPGGGKVKVERGGAGDEGSNTRIEDVTGVYKSAGTPKRGGNGWSARDPAHTGAMDGEPGKEGHPGNQAGSIFILSNDTDFQAPLSLSAVGGPGGRGQDGQEGAEGGRGGKGFNAEVVSDSAGTFKVSTAGGDGGAGGNGGSGGRGGPGGDGGRIVFHSISTSPQVTTACEGGAAGGPGEGGKEGGGGAKGAGGRSAKIHLGYGNYRTLHESPPGKPGDPGTMGARGKDAPPSNAGTAKVATGELLNEELASMASVTQLQMLFERIRAQYLITEPHKFRLLLQSVGRKKDLVGRGRNLVVVAAVGPQLHIRVFDSGGAIAIDQPESELAGGDRLETLKRRLKGLGLRLEPIIEMTPRGALLSGGWAKETDKEPAGGWHKALVSTLIDNTDIRYWGHEGAERYHAQFGTSTLTDQVVRIAVLLRTGLRNKGTMPNPQLLRRELVLATQEKTGRPEEELWGLSVPALADLSMEWSDAFRRDLRIDDISEEDRQKVFEDVAGVWGKPDCLAWFGIGPQLNWVARMLIEIPDKHPQKPLASFIGQSVWTVLANYNNGLDYFGKTPEFAPVVSLNTYLRRLESSLKTLKLIEDAAKPYFTSLRDSTNAANDLLAAAATTSHSLTLLNGRKSEILKVMNGEEGVRSKIGKFESGLEKARKDLQKPLDDLKVQVKEAFGLTVETFFNCLSQLSFTNVHEPASALAMGISQIGTMWREATTKVKTDSGEPINKDWVLEQIVTIGEEVDLRSELLNREKGFLAYDGSDRLLVQIDKFRELCRKFYNSLDDARTVRRDLDAYIEKITARNRQIDYYNLLVRELLDLSAEIKAQEFRRIAVNGALADGASPGLPAMTTFVSGLYERAKAMCASDFYLTYRAYAFWALAPNSGFYDKIGRSPGAITYEQLEYAKSELMNDILTALGSNYRIPNRFPTKVDSETTMGRVVVLTKVSHHLFFEDLADSGAAEFELEPATKNGFGPTDNFAPTSCAWPSPGAVFNVGNPFAGQADVRLTKVRVWMVGKESKLDHNVILVHLGKEQFRRSNDTPYPKRLDPPEQEDEDLRKSRYVVHEPVSIPFNYNAEGLSYDPDARSFTPGKLFGRRVGSQDGDLRFPKDGINDLPAAGEYAPIGPFGRWRLVVPKNLNPKLDLSELHAVVIDFHGFHQAYDQDLLR